MMTLRYGVLLILLLPSLVLSDICSLDVCDCEDSEVRCQGDNTEDILITPASLPPLLTSLTFANFSNIKIHTNSFGGQNDLKELSFQNIQVVELSKYFYSSATSTNNLIYFNLENLQLLTLASENCFENFPHVKKINLKNVRIEEIPSRGLKLESDHLTFEDCSIGEIARAGVYTDVDNLILINNHFDSIKTHAFSGNINVFNFTGNTVKMLEDEAFQLSALNIEFSNNNIESIKGSPFKSLSPTPVCVADSDYDDYPDSQYRVVASSQFSLQNNNFAQFDVKMLHFPGSGKVPLGSLRVNKNKVMCDCSMLKELVETVDYDYQISSYHSFGEFVLLKEFFTSGLCTTDADEGKDEEVRLPKYSRDNFQYKDKGVICQKNTSDRKKEKVTSDSKVGEEKLHKTNKNNDVKSHSRTTGSRIQLQSENSSNSKLLKLTNSDISILLIFSSIVWTLAN